MAGSATPHWYVIAGADRSPGTWLVFRGLPSSLIVQGRRLQGATKMGHNPNLWQFNNFDSENNDEPSTFFGYLHSNPYMRSLWPHT